MITLETFNLAGELNPQLNKDLKVLIVSPDLITSMFLLSPNFQADYRNHLEQYLDDMHTTATGKQVLTTFQSEKITKLPASVITTTRNILDDYQTVFGDGNQ